MPITPSRKVTRGKRVSPDKLSLAKQLRREMTPAERRLWAAIRRNAIDGFHFRRQQVIEGYVVDFYCSRKVGDRTRRRVHQEQWKYDQSRDKTIIRAGVRVLRIPNERMIC